MDWCCCVWVFCDCELAVALSWVWCGIHYWWACVLGVVGAVLVLLVLHAYGLFSFGFAIAGCVALVGYLDCGLQGRCL